MPTSHGSGTALPAHGVSSTGSQPRCKATWSCLGGQTAWPSVQVWRGAVRAACRIPQRVLQGRLRAPFTAGRDCAWSQAAHTSRVGDCASAVVPAVASLRCVPKTSLMAGLPWAAATHQLSSACGHVILICQEARLQVCVCKGRHVA